MSLQYDSSGLLPGAYAYIHAHIDDVKSIAPPSETFTRLDLDRGARRHLQKLTVDGAIEIVGETDDGYKLYQTREAAWDAIEDCREAREELLCGHGGIRNLGNGLYTCTKRDCEHKYTRDTIEVLLEPIEE